MRIGLLRHFPVQLPFPSGWKTAGELHLWHQQYDAAPVTVRPADVGPAPWTHCVCSDLSRAVTTATTVFHGPIEQTPLLREAEFEPFRTANLRLPLRLWIWILRLTWATGHQSQRACRDAFRRRVAASADLLVSKTGDTLAVSHGGMMIFLSAELRRRGFSGPKLRMPNHATLYTYERASGS